MDEVRKRNSLLHRFGRVNSNSSMSFMAGEHYDALQSGDDWPPESFHEISGSVKTPKGEPAENAQVVAYFTRPQPKYERWTEFSCKLKGSRLGPKIGGPATLTNETGQFKLSIPNNQPFSLIATGPDGFCRIAANTESRDIDLQLQSWARIKAEKTEQSDFPQKFSCLAHLPASEGFSPLTLHIGQRP